MPSLKNAETQDVGEILLYWLADDGKKIDFLSWVKSAAITWLWLWLLLLLLMFNGDAVRGFDELDGNEGATLTEDKV